jgi:hypothetical protein
MVFGNLSTLVLCIQFPLGLWYQNVQSFRKRKEKGKSVITINMNAK